MYLVSKPDNWRAQREKYRGVNAIFTKRAQSDKSRCYKEKRMLNQEGLMNSGVNAEK